MKDFMGRATFGKEVKAALKAAFPGKKFGVRNVSGSEAVVLKASFAVDVPDDVEKKEVEKFLERYENAENIVNISND